MTAGEKLSCSGRKPVTNWAGVMMSERRDYQPQREREEKESERE